MDITNPPVRLELKISQKSDMLKKRIIGVAISVINLENSKS